MSLPTLKSNTCTNAHALYADVRVPESRTRYRDPVSKILSRHTKQRPQQSSSACQHSSNLPRGYTLSAEGNDHLGFLPVNRHVKTGDQRTYPSAISYATLQAQGKKRMTVNRSRSMIASERVGVS
ncbi:hypothetical protein G7K_4897-t1 [Saitoella complicata NRRL Y-17804]|uniref:Uncharacterized protein n=1 Tax=Saitoella complicata (strain BCRC 22490 / CBS 7301 / JCM 7358 / NBRC 10748 / NRRL Y-17804) TaxID=698492 RepID=A0A0E9NM48_SAICN|nr:hypothetical protein G7K_4897-t1 [Saitoella complicata NRRL Y-17804]